MDSGSDQVDQGDDLLSRPHGLLGKMVTSSVRPGASAQLPSLPHSVPEGKKASSGLLSQEALRAAGVPPPQNKRTGGRP